MILDNDICWNTFRNLPSFKEKQEIVNWKGWHWILKGQLECFFRLKDQFKPKSNDETKIIS